MRIEAVVIGSASKKRHVKPEELRCLGKTDISSEQGQMCCASRRKMKAIKGAQRRAELGNPPGGHSVMMLLNLQEAVQLLLEKMRVKLVDDL
jgi:hypothetical protein